MLVDNALWLYGRGIAYGDIDLADATRIVVTISRLPRMPGYDEVLTEEAARSALLQWRTRPVAYPRSADNRGVSGAGGTAFAAEARVPVSVAFMLVPFDDPTAAALSRPAGARIRDAMVAAADTAGDDDAWFCWHLGRRLYEIDNAFPFNWPPGPGGQDPEVTVLSRWIGSLTTLLRWHARYLDPTRPFPHGWPAPGESPSNDLPAYFPCAAPGSASTGITTPL